MNYVNRAIVFSKDDCPWCDKARSLLTRHRIPFKELKLGTDYSKEDLIDRMGYRTTKLTVPQIWFVGPDNTEWYVGGYTALEKEIDIPSEK